ncbi:trypsin-like peptidase domain-containing protein [bacterium]|nr:trypsin-like peptidase domain-containing protein [bacterium]
MSNRSASSIRNGALTLLIALFVLAAAFMISGRLRPVDTDRPEQEVMVEEPGEAVSPSPLDQGTSPSDVVAQLERAPKRSERPASGFESPFVGVAERLKPSVVNVTVTREVSGYEDFHDFFFRGDQQSPRPRRATSGGSGFIIDDRGHVLTNHHVVEDATEIRVTLFDGEERDATLIGADPETDIALLEIGKVEASWVADLGDSEEIRIGDWAIAMGNPMGLDWTLTVGVISAKGRSDLSISGGGPVFQDFIQTDASINFGNSGGPLANIQGEVIGVNSAVSTSAQGIGFAIPINMARDVVADLLESGYVQRGYLGMMPVELDDLKKEALGLDISVAGIFVESVSPDTPAEAGGLMATDVITAVDGQTIEDVTQFRLLVAQHKPGEAMELTIIRDQQERTLLFTLADRSDYVATANPSMNNSSHSWMGLRVMALTNPQARQFDIEVEHGVVVVNIEQESPSEGKLQIGDVIAKVGGKQVHTLSDWQQITAGLGEPARAVLVMYYRGGKGISHFTALKR